MYNDSYQLYLDGTGGGAFILLTEAGSWATYNGTVVQDRNQRIRGRGLYGHAEQP